MTRTCTECGVTPGSLVASCATAPCVVDWLDELRGLVERAQLDPECDTDAILSGWLAVSNCSAEVTS